MVRGTDDCGTILTVLLTISLLFLVALIVSYVILADQKRKRADRDSKSPAESLENSWYCRQEEDACGATYDFEDLPEPLSYVASISHVEGPANIRFLCTGVIVSRVLVLTSAECLQLSVGSERIVVRVGSRYWYKSGSVHKLVDVLSHKNLMLLKLAPKLSYKYNVLAGQVLNGERGRPYRMYVWQENKSYGEIDEKSVPQSNLNGSGGGGGSGSDSICHKMTDRYGYGQPIFTNKRLHGMITAGRPSCVLTIGDETKEWIMSKVDKFCRRREV